MRSPVLNKYESKLIEINDQLCFFLFSDAQIQNSLSTKSKITSGSYTTEAFPDNPFSERLYIKVQALPAFREKAFNTLVSMIVIASIEYLLGYINDIEKFRASVSPTDADAISKEKVEEQLEEKLNCWSNKEPEKGLIKTIEYLRLRRNHIAHVKEEMSDGYKSLIKNYSHYLNKYWGKRITKLNNFDFSKKVHSKFSAEEIFALINLT